MLNFDLLQRRIFYSPLFKDVIKLFYESHLKVVHKSINEWKLTLVFK